MPWKRGLVWALTAVSLALGGCHPDVLVTRRPVPRADFDVDGSVTLILPPLTSPLAGKASTPRYRDLPNRLGTLFEAAAAHVVEERDVIGPPAERTWLLRIQLLEARTGADARTTEVELEVTAFDASGAPVERVATHAGITLMVDTSGRPAILRDRYSIEMVVDFGTRGSSRDELDAFEDEFAAVLAAQLYQQLAPDLARAIATTPPFVQAIEATPVTPVLSTP